MNNKYNVIKTPTDKITIVITRHQLWKNFITSWADMAWDDYTIGTAVVKQVADVLLNGEPLSNNVNGLRQLFKNGWTSCLMGEIDNGEDILREIVVTDDNDPQVTIHHKHIEF